ncbi:MAG: hypothetical protein PHD02_03020 [Bacilli bacterium]|nr:hypothetical protein [Bacilli bacterium]
MEKQESKKISVAESKPKRSKKIKKKIIKALAIFGVITTLEIGGYILIKNTPTTSIPGNKYLKSFVRTERTIRLIEGTTIQYTENKGYAKYNSAPKILSIDELEQEAENKKELYYNAEYNLYYKAIWAPTGNVKSYKKIDGTIGTEYEVQQVNIIYNLGNTIAVPANIFGQAIVNIEDTEGKDYIIVPEIRESSKIKTKNML